jgi:hypothetical protein
MPLAMNADADALSNPSEPARLQWLRFSGSWFMPPLTKIEEIKLRVMSDLQVMFAELRRYQERHDLVRELDTAILRSTFSAAICGNG